MAAYHDDGVVCQDFGNHSGGTCDILIVGNGQHWHPVEVQLPLEISRQKFFIIHGHGYGIGAMTVQQGVGFGIGLIDRKMQSGIHRGIFAELAIEVAFDQVATTDKIGAAAGGCDPECRLVPYRSVAAVGVIEAVLAEPTIVSNEVVFEVHGAALYLESH